MNWNTLPWWINVLGGSLATAILAAIGFLIKRGLDSRRGIRDTVQQLRDKLLEYENKATIRATLLPHDDAYYSRIEYGKEINYCSACFDDKGKLIKLSRSGKWYLSCPICHYTSDIDGKPKDRDEWAE